MSTETGHYIVGLLEVKGIQKETSKELCTVIVPDSENPDKADFIFPTGVKTPISTKNLMRFCQNLIARPSSQWPILIEAVSGRIVPNEKLIGNDHELNSRLIASLCHLTAMLFMIAKCENLNELTNEHVLSLCGSTLINRLPALNMLYVPSIPLQASVRSTDTGEILYRNGLLYKFKAHMKRGLEDIYFKSHISTGNNCVLNNNGRVFELYKELEKELKMYCP